MSKPKLELFTLLTSVRLESETSGIKEDGLYHIGKEVNILPGYGQGLVDNQMAVKGKVEPPEEPEIDEKLVEDGVSQEVHNEILKQLSDAKADLDKEKEEHAATAKKLQTAVDGEAASKGKVTSLEAEVDDLKSKLSEAAKPAATPEKSDTK